MLKTGMVTVAGLLLPAVAYTLVLFTNLIRIFPSDCAEQSGAALTSWSSRGSSLSLALHCKDQSGLLPWAQMVNNMKLWGPSRLMANSCSLFEQVNCLQKDGE